ncbi:hypothetical protein [Pseudoxanthomonas mexicana]|uniref:hypothetical protein n=1 Tax=Pseudoxanthomonas mexicana TaxID=128785 RepID=UPI001FD6819E|nr:hypothetical protein [Pseudoxanthomonas mexicana]UOV00781.1 hypothetical protein MUU73_12345 [Pseudoxanthomonas mexicana]
MDKDRAKIIAPTTERWVLEVYRTIIETLQGFAVALLAYMVVRVSELKRATSPMP